MGRARIVERVCGEGVSVEQLCETWPAEGNRLMVRNYLTLRLKEALEVLAVDVWGATGRARVPMRSERAEAGTFEGADAARMAQKQAQGRGR